MMMQHAELSPLILVVDDDEQVREWLRIVLEEEGYRVIEAGDGNQAFKTMEQAVPDLVVLDMFLPDKDGLETILQLRNERASVKVLAVSGQPIDAYDVFKVATTFGAHAALAKPFRAEALIERVRSLVGPVRHQMAS